MSEEAKRSNNIGIIQSVRSYLPDVLDYYTIDIELETLFEGGLTQCIYVKYSNDDCSYFIFRLGRYIGGVAHKCEISAISALELCDNKHNTVQYVEIVDGSPQIWQTCTMHENYGKLSPTHPLDYIQFVGNPHVCLVRNKYAPTIMVDPRHTGNTIAVRLYVFPLRKIVEINSICIANDEDFENLEKKLRAQQEKKDRIDQEVNLPLFYHSALNGGLFPME
jgi:hypothetical protein